MVDFVQLCREQRSYRHWWDNVNIQLKLAQREAFIYSVRMKVSGSLEKGKNANCYVVGGVVWKV